METESEFRVLFEATPGLVVALRPDPPAFTVIAATNGYLKATGTRRNNIVGRGFFDVFPGYPGEARNKATANLKRSFETVLRNRSADMMAIQKYPICPVELSGEGWEERYWRGINSPVLGPTGEVAYILHRAQDMTELVRLKAKEVEHEQLKLELQVRAEKAEAEQLAREQQIQRLNRHLRRALTRQQRSRPEAYLPKDWLEHVLLEVHEQVFALDRKWRYVYVNDRVTQVVGLTKEQMLGKTIWELFPEVVGSVFERQIRQAVAEFSPVHFEYCYPPWKRWFEMHVYPSAERLTVFVAEITERKKAEAALQESQERLAGELVTMNRLHELTLRLFGALDLREAMAEVLEAVTALMDTNMGDIRIYDPVRDALDIVAQSGFPVEFIEQYRNVSSQDTAACARAMRARNRVVVDDIETDALSEPERLTAAAGGYRAVQSTPLLSRGGNLLGVLSTYCRNPSKLTERDFKILDLYGRFTADLIERLQVEKTLRDSEERLRLATQFGKVGVWDWDLIANRMSWTESLYVIYGVRPVSFSPTVENVVSMIHPDDRERVLGLIEKILRSETACELEFRAVQPPGDIIWLFTNARALFDNGRPVRMLGATVDITERKRAEQALHESEERFRDMADHAPMMVWVTEPDGSCCFVSKSWYKFTGEEPESGLGHGWTNSLHPDDQSDAHQTFLAANRRQTPFRLEYRLRRADGEYRWVIDAAAPRFSKDGTFLGYIGSVIDITERKGIEDALKEADRRKDEFLANMSHEIRSPMTAILGYAEILLDRLQDSHNVECVATIKQSGNYLLEIINDLLDLSKIESGKITLQNEPISVPVLLNEIHSLMSVRAKEKRLRFSLSYDGPIPETINSDRIRLRQILINLCANGIKFTEAGTVQIMSRFLPESSALQFEVSDTGVGIPSHMQARLFQPFTQADTSATREFGGTGLGLAITKRLVDLMRGSISFETELDKGTTFKVTIPVETPQKKEFNGALNDRRSDPATEGSRIDCRVLVVDDRPEMRSLFRYFIEEAGGRVSTAEDGRTAVEAVRSAETEGQPIDLVLMDIQMPGVDGYEATRNLRAEGFANAIVALTASAMKTDRERCLAAGCNDYLTKPVQPDQLIDLIGRYCHS